MHHRTITSSGILALLVLSAAGCPPDTTFVESDTGPTSDLDRDGFSIAEGDCDDGDPDTYPNALDVVGDDTDQNCDDVDGVDDDDDDQASMASGGEDCNDADNTIYARAPEIGWDGIDQNCDKVDQYDFLEIGGGKYHTCGLDSQGLIRCWGKDDKGQVTSRPLDAGWKHVCSGFEFSCATHEDGRLSCWGSNTGDQGALTRQITDAPTDTMDWDQVTCGWDFACALNLQGRATCWGSDDYEQVSGAPTQIDLISISGGHDHACAIDRAFNKLICWGRDDLLRNMQVSVDALNATQLDGDEPEYNSVTCGADHTCAIRRDLGLVCFGLDQFDQASSTNDAGPYSNLSAGGNFTCGSLEQTTLTCWGENNFYQISEAPIFSKNIRYVGLGIEHACGMLKDNGEVVCWGRDLEGQSAVPIWAP